MGPGSYREATSISEVPGETTMPENPDSMLCRRRARVRRKGRSSSQLFGGTWPQTISILTQSNSRSSVASTACYVASATQRAPSSIGVSSPLCSNSRCFALGRFFRIANEGLWSRRGQKLAPVRQRMTFRRGSCVNWRGKLEPITSVRVTVSRPFVIILNHHVYANAGICQLLGLQI